MRIGTWNIEGRWSDAHLQILDSADCDVWLLTEVSDDVAISGFTVSATTEPMRGSVRWAAVASRLPIESLPDPHPASAMARVDGVTYVSSVLPWRGCGNVAPWHGEDHTERTREAVDVLVSRIPDHQLCWGGDWNHALSGREWAGSQGGRVAIAAATTQLGLTVPTAKLPHALDGLLSIDHIAVPMAWTVLAVERIRALGQSERLSDHDLYVLEVKP